MLRTNESERPWRFNGQASIAEIQPWSIIIGHTGLYQRIKELNWLYQLIKRRRFKVLFGQGLREVFYLLFYLISLLFVASFKSDTTV